MKVIFGIYMASVDFNHRFHIKACRLQSACICDRQNGILQICYSNQLLSADITFPKISIRSAKITPLKKCNVHLHKVLVSLRIINRESEVSTHKEK